MRKRILSIVLTVLMVVSLLPAVAFAGESPLAVPEILAKAAKYEYEGDSAYSYTGKVSTSDNIVYYTIKPNDIKDGSPIMNDLARYIGAMWRFDKGVSAKQITFNNTEYTWNSESALKGSNWENNSTTLISAITAVFKEQVTNFATNGSKLTFKLNGEDVTIVLIALTGLKATGAENTDYKWEDESKTLKILKDGVTVSGATATQAIRVDSSVRNLTLKDVKIIPAEYGYVSTGVDTTSTDDSTNLTITLSGDTIIGNPVNYKSESTTKQDYTIQTGISAGYDITFTGSGKLTIYDRGMGIKANNVTFDTNFSGTLTIEDFGDAEKCAICAGYEDEQEYIRGDISLLGGNFNITSYTSYGIYAYGNITIKNANVAVNTKSIGICALYGVNLIDCLTMDIDAETRGIYAKYGDVLIDNCDDLDIDAGTYGIYQDYVHADSAPSGYSCSVTIKNCDGVNINAAKSNCIYAGGIWNDNGTEDDNDDIYISGGDVTITDCGKVTLNNIESGYTGIYADGGVKLINCSIVDIDAGWNGIYATYGDIEIANCSNVDVQAITSGIYAYDGNVKITNSKLNALGNAARFKEIYGYDLIWEENWCAGICADGVLTIQNSTVESAGPNIGCNFLNGSTLYRDGGTSSHGFFAEKVVITNSTVTAKGGTADYANGLNVIGSMTITGNSTVNAYGGNNAGTSGAYTTEYYAIWTKGDVLLDGRNVVLNLCGGNNGLQPGDNRYLKQAYVSEWRYDEDELVAPSLTVKNGAELTADSQVWVQGDVTIDGGNVQIATPIGTALSAGGYKNDGKNNDDYFGTLTMRNNATLIATAKDEYSTVFAYKGMDIKDSELFASASESGSAIGCYLDNINFNNQTFYGSLEEVAYSNRKTLNTAAKIGKVDWGYTALVGDDVAGTVYNNNLKKSSGGSVSSYAITVNESKNGSIIVDKRNASSGSTVTITVTPNKGFTLETLSVIDKDGKDVEVKNLGNNKYSFKMPSSKVGISATFMEDNSMLNFFVDVKANDYYYDAVKWAAENGITTGTNATHFSPNGTTTRAQMVTFLWRMAGSPVFEDDDIKFTDIKKTDYFYDAVVWGWNMGIVSGKSATRFAPDDKVTRGEAVTFIYRYAKVAGGDLPNPFTDVKQSEFYYYPVLWAANNEITSGINETTFAPSNNCDRAQVACFLYRFNNKFK